CGFPAGGAVRPVVDPRGPGRLDRLRAAAADGGGRQRRRPPRRLGVHHRRGDSIIRAYDEATSAIAFLAARKGKSAPVDLLAAVGEARLAPGTSEYHVDHGLRAVYGAGFAQFQKDWNGGKR